MTIEKLIKKLGKEVRELDKKVDRLVGENYHSESEYVWTHAAYLREVIKDLQTIKANSTALAIS